MSWLGLGPSLVVVKSAQRRTTRAGRCAAARDDL